jgi:hypothetical protein
MSAESLVIAKVVAGGPAILRRCYAAGVTPEYFSIYTEEWDWLERQVAKRRQINVRTFRQRFPDFEWLPSEENLEDLISSLQDERAYIDAASLLESTANDLRVDNAVEMLRHLHDSSSAMVSRVGAVEDRKLIESWPDHREKQRQLKILRDAGESPGIPTGLKWIDFHWDGLVPGRMIVVLGRPGDGKSLFIVKLVWSAIKHQNNVLFFSPEMSEFEHACRLHTIASADPDVKKALGLRHSFRNRALMNGIGYNPKSYRAFLEYLHGNCGEVIMPTGINRRLKMTPAFVDSKIEEHQPDLVVVDPIYKLKAPMARRTQYEELSDVSDMIQDLAESHNVPIVVSNQAHRQQSKKEDAPGKDSSFNSDVPIQEADHVVGVKHISEEHRMIVRCTKSRFGEDFRFEMNFWPNTGLMCELDEPAGSYYNGNDEDADEEEVRKIIEQVKGKEVMS